jgi:hypothetical protein
VNARLHEAAHEAGIGFGRGVNGTEALVKHYKPHYSDDKLQRLREKILPLIHRTGK